MDCLAVINIKLLISLRASGLDINTTKSLLSAADKYFLDDLKVLCEDTLVGNEKTIYQ